jgi:RHS repeat-associated protein
MVKNPGGFIPLTYWHTNEMTTFVYDGWNLVHEVNALTNGTMQEVSYFWGKDLSGSMQGAGGVGGLLAASIDGDFYFPCYDNNGNITAYIDEGGSVIAYRQFDAFGNTIAKGGAMVDTLHFWYSTKYLEHETGLYYYGYRHYSPMLQRWLNRDPIEEQGGVNLYGFCLNAPVNFYDHLGMWLEGDTTEDGNRRVYSKEKGDTFADLANRLSLDLDSIHKWAKFVDEKGCKVSVPNVWISADLLQGGCFSRIINIGGTVGQFWGTDLGRYGYKFIKPTTMDDLVGSLIKTRGNLYGMTVYAHGDKKGYIGGYSSGRTLQINLINAVRANGYRIAEANMMQCYSFATVNGVNFERSWRSVAVKPYGYYVVNFCGVDL